MPKQDEKTRFKNYLKAIIENPTLQYAKDYYVPIGNNKGVIHRDCKN